MSTRIRGLLTAAAVVFATTAAAQSAPLQGVVRDESGRPVPGVVVTVEHPEETAVRVVLTDLNGRYAVRELERGTRYRVEASHPSFRKARVAAEPGRGVIVTLKPRRSCPTEGQQSLHAPRP
jgi:hypothetical protein